MEITYKNTEEVIPYINNPRQNDHAVDKVASSIKNYGFRVPIVIDEQNEIIAGHTRVKAAKKLGMSQVPCIVADDLTEAQKKAFRIADNKTAEIADWDIDQLLTELKELDELGIDVEDVGFDDSEIEELMKDPEEANPYTQKLDTPVYEVTGDKPSLNELFDKTKADELQQEIIESNLTAEEKEFLMIAATRHYTFNYSKIAEYYAHASPEMQKLMEQSALVIIDYHDAIKEGYVQLTENMKKLMNIDEKGDEQGSKEGSSHK